MWALDKVEIRTEVRPYFHSDNMEREDREPGTDPRAVLIYGLFLDGASWSNRKLADPVSTVPATMPVASG